MTILNNYTLVDRANRPGTLQRVGLRCLFYQNGVLTDPYEISGVTIYQKLYNTSPSTVLTSANQIDVAATSGVVTMHFSPSGTGGFLTTNSVFDATNYAPGAAASGVYKLGTGDYVVVLDGTLSLSGNLSSLLGYATTATEIANTASSVATFIDVWTVRHTVTGPLTEVINEFRLYDDTFLTVTEPLLLTHKHRLLNRRIVLGETIDLKIKADITIDNCNLDPSIKNIFDQSVIVSAGVQIEKVNDSEHLPTFVTVSSFANTSSTVMVTSDDTIVLPWNTNVLTNWSNETTEQTKRNDIGSPTGVYAARVFYTVLGETIKSPRMYFTVS